MRCSPLIVLLALHLFISTTLASSISIEDVDKSPCGEEEYVTKLLSTGGGCNRPLCVVEKRCSSGSVTVSVCSPLITKNIGHQCPDFTSCSVAEDAFITAPYDPSLKRDAHTPTAIGR